MQLAVIDGDMPWVCNVYYVCDTSANIYWLSLPSRHHSKLIQHNSKAAIAIAIKQDMPVVGVQAQGIARVVKSEETVKKIAALYVQKYNVGHNFYSNFVEGINQHQLYRFQTDDWVIFDEINFSKGPRRQIKLA